MIDIIQNHEVALFGIFNSENYARELQYNLAFHQKICFSFLDIHKQIEYLRESQGWVIIYSMSGEYVLDNGYPRYYGILKALKESQAHIVVITCQPKVATLDYIDEVIMIHSKHGYHSYLVHCLNDWILASHIKRNKQFPKVGNKN